MKGEISRTRWLLTGATVLALASVTVPASAGKRPLSDFTSRLETWCAVITEEGNLDCAQSYYGGPACANGGFTFPAFITWTDPQTGVSAGIDSLGTADEQLFGGELGTSLDGTIAESAAPGGFADVKVTIHTSNALTRAYTFDADFNTIPLFGYLIFEVLDGAPPTLGDSFLQITFSNTAQGAPLPDLGQLQNCPAPGQALQMFSGRAQASGPLREGFGVPEGTPGRLEVTQTGLIGTALLANPHSRVALDAFPAEHIIIRATGK